MTNKFLWNEEDVVVLDSVGVEDAKPRTLYVRRDLLNAADVHAHYSDQLGAGLAALLMDPSKWHVTIAYSRTPVDWIKAGEDWQQNKDGEVEVPPGGARLHERLGKDGAQDAVVLQFTSSALSSRWHQLHADYSDVGCSWDFPDYQPHVTIAWDAKQTIDLSGVEPWRGPLVFGPEVFEEIDEDWKVKAGIDERGQ